MKTTRQVIIRFTVRSTGDNTAALARDLLNRARMCPRRGSGNWSVEVQDSGGKFQLYRAVNKSVVKEDLK